MSEHTVIDKDVEVGPEVTLENRLVELEDQVAFFLQGQKNILEHLRELISTLTEIHPDYYEE